MAYEEWEQEHHLTPAGWVAGSFFFRGTLARKVPIPSDRVLTLVRECANRLESSGLQTTWRQDWKSSDQPPEAIDHLLGQFGQRPPEQYTSPLKNASPTAAVPDGRPPMEF